MTLREVLHAHVPTLRPDATFRDAIDRMDVYQFAALVVLDEDAKPSHVVTEGDLCRAVHARGDSTSLAGDPVTVFSTSDPICSSPDAEISDALHLMLSRGLTVLPVVEQDRFIGVAFRMDLIQAMLMDVVPDDSK